MVDGGTEMVADADYRVVDSAYFRTLGIPLLRGRGFTEADRAGAPHVVLINRAMAERYWPGADPIGHRIRPPGMDEHASEWLTIVGVVGDVHDRGLDSPPAPAMFIHYPQRPENLPSGATVLVRTSVAPDALGAAVRGRVQAADPNVPVSVSTLSALVTESVGARRFATVVLSTFAALALLLAALGIYGVLAYSVAQRQREIGVRMALGAHQGAVRAMVLQDAMRAVLPGVVVGLAAAYALTRLLRSLLYGVAATDPATFATVAVVLTAVAVVASWVPARRATRVDPMIAIRAD
jgi:putative ABC transport system permease protein